MASQADLAAADALTAAYLARQRLLVSSLTRDLVILLRQVFHTSDPGQSWPATRLAVDALIRERRRAWAAQSARYYVDLRQLSLPQDQHPARTTPSPGSAGPGTGLVRTADEPTQVSVGRTLVQGAGEAINPAGSEELLSEDDAWAELERIAPVKPGDVDDIGDDRMDANLNATGIASYKRAVRAGQTPERARDTMTTTLAGSATTLALEGGRQIIHDAAMGDDEAIGWARITDPDPCAFCSMLASRGAIYHSRETAGAKANKRFVGEGMFKFHNHDQCQAKPIFDPDDPALKVADELYERWLKVTRAESGKKMIDAWTAYWNTLDPADKPTVQAAAE